MNGHANLCWLWSPEPRPAIPHVRGPGDCYARRGNGACAELCDPLVAWLSERLAEDENTGRQVSIRQGDSEPCLWATPSPFFPLRQRAPGESMFYGQREGLGTRVSFCQILGQMVDSFSFPS